MTMDPAQPAREDAPLLLSLPQASARASAWLGERGYGPLFVASDPPGRQLGSGGGTAALLDAAWRSSARGAGGLLQWVTSGRLMVIHGSGESRRLPSYAASGKPLIPLPAIPLAFPQRPVPVLLDLQVEAAARLLRAAPVSYRMELICGDVFIQFERWLPAFPEADVLIVGLPASPEEAQHHGVMVCESGRPEHMLRFLQKPSARSVQELQRTNGCWLDTGTWFFSAKAIEVLMRKCGWDPSSGAFAGGSPGCYDIYGSFGLSLGTNADAADPDVRALTSAVLPLPDGRFYHFGTSRSIILSAQALATPAGQRCSFGDGSSAPSMVVLHSDVAADLSAARDTWIENSVVPAGWRLSRGHVLTGIPANDWSLELEPGVCVDVASSEGGYVARPYGFDDPMRGAAGDASTLFIGRPFGEWLKDHAIDLAAIPAKPDLDIFDAPLFPVLSSAVECGEILRWMLAHGRVPASPARDKWLASRRLSARAMLAACDTRAPVLAREGSARRSLASDPDLWTATPPRLDFGALSSLAPRLAEPAEAPASLPGAHRAMYDSALAARRGDAASAAAAEATAFRMMRDTMVHEMELAPVRPRRNTLEDQIVWGRSPVRLDLAGGWTDTPPYCMEYGGRVVNVAVDLNGQPPIQVFARLTREPHIVVRSIDLGIEERMESYESLRQFGQLGSGFGIAHAALALCGFDPRFLAGKSHGSLRDYLAREIGGGIDIAMLAAVPKGSGLGTSSILAATVLGTLGELLGMEWSQQDIIARTLVLEQILGAGGGWQDQVGGVTRGLKLIETKPGLVQNPVLRWLPDRLFGPGYANRTVLLYYTGLTRVAHGILNEIVRGIFLNAGRHVGLIREIGENAGFAADVLQRGEWNGFCEAVRRSWVLNRHLDSGTNPPAVQAIVDRIGDLAAAVKLPGAGGGGYLLVLARDEEAGGRIRRRLAESPPNAAARFVNLGVSETGLQVTRS
jgi:galactokinase/mevalonate kinase-like predicted kinase